MAHARILFAFIVICILSEFVTACGGGGGGSTSPASPTITSVSVSCSPSSITTAQTSTCSATVTGTGSYNSGVTWTASGGTITNAGVFTPTAAGNATITATSTEDLTKFGQASVTVSLPPTITAVTVSCSPALITDNQTAQCNAVVQGTGSYNTSVTWEASAGAVAANGVYTPPSLTSYTVETITATSVQNPSISGKASLPVQRKPPTGGSWVPIGPDGGNVIAIASDLTNPTVVYAGTYVGGTGGLWKSTNGGLNWVQLLTGLAIDYYGVSDIVVTNGGQTIIVASGYIILSTDGGNSWAEITLPASGVMSLAVTPADSSTIYASVLNYGVIKSSDTGKTWAYLNGSPKSGSIFHHALQVDRTNPSVVYFGTDTGMTVSRDAGQTWNPSTVGIASGDTSVRDLATDPITPGKVYAIAGSPSLITIDLYVSTDSAKTWSPLAQGYTAERVVPDLLSANTVYLYELQCDMIERSTDGGKTFHASDTGVPQGSCSGGATIFSSPVGTMAVLNTSPETFLALGPNTNLYRSTDGQNWSPSTSGISAWFGIGVAVDPQNTNTVYFQTNLWDCLFKSIDGGSTWNLSLSPSPGYGAAVDPFDSTHVIAFGTGGLMESHDGGVSWNAVSGLPSAGIREVAFHPSIKGTIFISVQGGVGVLRSTDGGKSYQVSNSGMNNGDNGWDLAVTRVVASTADANTLFLGTADGLLVSQDLGNSWNVLGFRGQEITAISVDANASPLALYVTTVGIDYKSTDVGNSWNQLSVGGAILVDPSSANSLFLMKTPEWSPDGGQTWVSFSEGIVGPALGYSDMDFSYSTATSSPQALYGVSLFRSLYKYVTGP